MITLRDEIFLKLGKELEIQQVIRCEGFFSDYSLHGLHVFSNSVTGILHKTQVNIYMYNIFIYMARDYNRFNVRLPCWIRT
jgi:hypothetical protein